jgi:phenylalanyl-tRNA synthetase beta chain
MQGNVRLFEVGSTFAPSSRPLPAEELRAGMLVMGQRRPPHFTEPKPPAYDEWDAKALAETAARAAYPGRQVALEPVGEGAVLWRISADGQEVGVVERLSLDAPVWASPAYGVEISIARVGEARDRRGKGRDLLGVPGPAATDGRAPRRARRFRPLPTTPAAEFDLALLVPESRRVGEVEAVMRRDVGELLEQLLLFDEFRGPGVPTGYRSLAWRLTFRHPERTLRDKEIDARRQRLLRTLESELGIRRRT